MQEHPEGISVVIPNYNGRDLLAENLPSVFAALEKVQIPWEVIVADDASTDDSVSYLRTEWPKIRIARTSANSGFSTSCNAGIEQTTYCYTCIVNSDVTFEPDYFENALPHLNDPELFAIKGDIVNYRTTFDDIQDINKDVVVYFTRGFFKFKDVYKVTRLRYDYTAALLGGCFICRTSVLKELGGYDEIFAPFYKEDLDLAMVAVEHGRRVKYVPGCRIYHKIGSTINKTHSPWKKYLVSKRNKFLLTWKHLKTVRRWGLHILFVLLSLLTRWIILDWKWYAAFTWAVVRKTRFKKIQD